MIDRIRSFARPVPVARQQNLADSILTSYSQALNRVNPDLFVEEGRMRYADPGDNKEAIARIPIMLAHAIQQFTEGGTRSTVEMPFTPFRCRFHYMETTDWYQAIPYFCRNLYAKLAEEAKKHSEYNQALEGGFLNWSCVTHIGHPIQFLARNWTFPSLLFDQALYTSSDGITCHGQVLFTPSTGCEKVWVRFRKNKLGNLLPGFVNDNFVTAQLMCIPGGTRLFAFLHKGHDEEARLYIANLAQLEEGSFVLLDEHQKRIMLGEEKDPDELRKFQQRPGQFETVQFLPETAGAHLQADSCDCPLCEAGVPLKTDTVVAGVNGMPVTLTPETSDRIRKALDKAVNSTVPVDATAAGDKLTECLSCTDFDTCTVNHGDPGCSANDKS